MRGVVGPLAIGLCLVSIQAGSTAEPLDIPKDGFPRTSPKTPAEALGTFRLQHGFTLELVAAEPLISSPIDVCYDADGRAYVVEMRGYPHPEKPELPRPEPMSRVRLLFDDDADGRFDRSTTFVDGLDWPTAVCPWKNGVFVADAPDIWYCRDDDGDGRADLREKVFTGFKRENVQALLNNLRWGLDGWIYGAASGNGGDVTSVAHPDRPAVSVARRDFRIHPETREFEAISGGARFGHSFDDWGNRFLCNIRNPVQQVVLSLASLRRNPSLVVATALHDVAEAGETLPVYRISPIEPWREFRARRWVQERVNFPRSELVGAGFFTSSSGVTIYRGGAYPAEFQGNAFVADVASNVVHRQVLAADGVTFRGRRMEEQVEFLASTDIWFRPVNFTNAPDGTLHVVDMYRENIEHPWSIPDDIRAQLDLSSGIDLGRIWKLVPPRSPGIAIPGSPVPALSTTPSADLVPHLASPHNWWRETAQRLLLEREARDVVPQIRTLLHTTDSATGQLHALWTLTGLDALSLDDLARPARDPHPGLREHAVLLAETRFAEQPGAEALAIAAARDDAPRVRFQAALSLGRWKSSASIAALAEIAQRDAGDPWLRTAVLSSAAEIAPQLLQACSQHGGSTDASALLEGLTRTAAARDDAAATAVLPLLSEWPEPAKRFALVAGWIDGLSVRKRNWSTFQGADAVAEVAHQASAVAVDAAAAVPLRETAIGLLKLSSWDEVQPRLPALLSPQQPREVQQAAVRLLGQFADPAAGRWLIAEYRKLSPSVRTAAVDLLASRPAWQPLLLQALADRIIPATDVPPSRRTQLLNLKDELLKARAAEFFSPTAPSPRKEVVDRAQPALSLAPKLDDGQRVFRRECAQCHRLGGFGEEVGPPLASVKHRSPAELLIHILDPNREVGPNFIDYAVTLDDGRVLTGLLAAESDTTLTLLKPQGLRETVRRVDIEDLASTGRSLMPEGLEQRLTPQELADVIEYMRR
jgi:putative membrane-bound dehydrogenase-like protein